ncbi:hypothetical protein IFM89_013339 [Coptis chinensis]|uniref:Uncharacterized protein n=1 Tax=Coptis chinensis TaxID=261450 RepID=A0A835HEH2_9MAGN|nr:hypothetical protein IFM89_013339 [Coptis chinensis]
MRPPRGRQGDDDRDGRGRGHDGGKKGGRRDGTELEYRVWDPYHSTLGCAIIGGLCNIWIAPVAKVLYLGARSGITCSLSYI